MHIAVPVRFEPLRGMPSRLRGLGSSCGAPWSNVGSQMSPSECQPPTLTAAGAPTSKVAGSVASSAAGIGATLLALSPATGPAAPFVAIAGAVAAFVTGTLGFGSGCGEACIDATKVANYAECIMHVNVNTYMSAPVHYASAQAAALAVFDQAWAYLQRGCGTIPGGAGSRCISERARGGRYDYFAANRDPIANDPCVVPDPSPVNAITGAASTAEEAVSSAVSAITGGGQSFLVPALLIVALLIVTGAMK